MHHQISLALIVCIAAASAQLILQQPSVYSGLQQPSGVAHRVVVENSIRESQLPAELLNEPYKNPAIAAALAKESLPTNKETIIFDRETDKIPRDRVFKIFRNAGWAQP